jgi:hypothetical protein
MNYSLSLAFRNAYETKKQPDTIVHWLLVSDVSPDSIKVIYTIALGVVDYFTS